MLSVPRPFAQGRPTSLLGLTPESGDIEKSQKPVCRPRATSRGNATALVFDIPTQVCMQLAGASHLHGPFHLALVPVIIAS